MEEQSDSTAVLRANPLTKDERRISHSAVQVNSITILFIKKNVFLTNHTVLSRITCVYMFFIIIRSYNTP